MESASQRMSTLVRHLSFDRKLLQFSPRSRLKMRAATLICLFEGDRAEARIFLIKRALKLSSYASKFALPGGRWEEGDKDGIETALREAKEEIGLDPSLIEVVAVLEPLEGRRNVATPVLRVLHEKEAYRPVLNLDEVALIFGVPLEMFLKDENRRADEKETAEGEKYHLQYFSYEADEGKRFMIWDFTAALLIRIASVLYQRPLALANKILKLWHV